MNLLKWFKRDVKDTKVNQTIENYISYKVEEGNKLTRGMIAAANSAIAKLMSAQEDSKSNFETLAKNHYELELLVQILGGDVQKLKVKDSTNLQSELDKARSELVVLRQMNDGWMAANNSLKEQLRVAHGAALHRPPDYFLPLPQKPSSIYVQPLAKSVDLDARKSPIEDLNLSLRVYNMLTNEGIKKVSDLCKYREIELRRIDRFGITALNEVQAALQQRGLRLRG